MLSYRLASIVGLSHLPQGLGQLGELGSDPTFSLCHTSGQIIFEVTYTIKNYEK